MRIIVVLTAIFAIFASSLLAEPVKEPRHLLVAKFLLKRLEVVSLTEEQRGQFNELSRQLRKEVDALREESKIDKVVMTRRDEAHQKLKGLKLDDEVYWKRLREDAALNEDQFNAFRKTDAKYKAFKKAVNDLLTKEQKAKLRKNRAKKK